MEITNGKFKDAISIDFPLRGEWVAPHTPGDCIPSHGTDLLGQRYAFDFFRTDFHDKNKFYVGSKLKYFILGIQVDKCLCYLENIYCPVDGKVIAAKDGLKEPRRLNPFIDLTKVIIRTISISLTALFIPLEKINLHRFIGNYIIIEFKDGYAFFAHISPNTINVKEGQPVKRGDLIGKVGHTGNSTAPHLHFHIMNSPDLLHAKGLPHNFTFYEVLQDGNWINIENGVPTSSQRIRV